MELSGTEENHKSKDSRNLRILSIINEKINKPIPRHMIMRLQNSKDKEKILKASRQKGTTVKLKADCSSATIEAATLTVE